MGLLSYLTRQSNRQSSQTDKLITWLYLISVSIDDLSMPLTAWDGNEVLFTHGHSSIFCWYPSGPAMARKRIRKHFNFDKFAACYICLVKNALLWITCLIISYLGLLLKQQQRIMLHLFTTNRPTTTKKKHLQYT